MIKPDIRILAKKISSRMDEIYPDAGLVFMSYWQRPGEEDSHTIIHGDPDLVQRCFREMEPKIRQLERCNLNPGKQSDQTLQNMIHDLVEDGDPEIVDLFQKVADTLLGDGKTRQNPYFGEAIILVGRMHLGINFTQYAEFVGMARGIVALFNAGIDSFRRLYLQGEERL